MNQVKFSEVAHLYYNCDLLEEGGNIGKLLSVRDIEPAGKQPLINCSSNEPYWGNWELIKPILRPLSDMTLEEGAWCLRETFFDHVNYPLSDFKIELVGPSDARKNPRISIDNDWYKESLTFGNKLGSIWGVESPAQNVKIKATVFAYLLSKHFDLFGMIESGQAIDSKAIKNKP